MSYEEFDLTLTLGGFQPPAIGTEALFPNASTDWTFAFVNGNVQLTYTTSSQIIEISNYLSPLTNGVLDVKLPLGNIGLQLNAMNGAALEFTDKTIFVTNSDNANIARLYEAAFGRAPDAHGLGGWETIFSNNIPSAAKSTGVYQALAQTTDGFGTSIAGGFVQSVEFQAKYGNLDDASFVTQLYLNVLDRTPDASEVNAWQNLMHSGDASGTHYTRDMVLVGFAESAENVANVAHAGWLIQV